MSRFWKAISGFLALIAVIHFYEKIFGPQLLLEEKSIKPTTVRCDASEEERYLLSAKSRVLVTGGAGFIGSSLMAQLASSSSNKIEKGKGLTHFGQRPGEIIGLDNFNNYYSPAYKRARAARLKNEFGLDVVDGDVCNGTLLAALLVEHKISHVVHLAAQAGVRYSLTHPLSYVKNNLECFVTLVEEIRKLPQEIRPSFVYASSSSVYGLNRKIPFSETDAVTNPANLYGASKFMNEQIASAYHHIYDLKSTGLRFFTVYGPWGRPDMAAFLFTRAIEIGKPLTVYNRGEMRRDFTYVDDIVSGIIGSMQYCSRSASVFNLGNNEPVELMTFINTIESQLGAKAAIQYKTSHAEIKETYADINKAHTLLGYTPKTPIELGMKHFISWYKQEPRRHTFAGGDFNNRRRSRR